MWGRRRGGGSRGDSRGGSECGGGGGGEAAGETVGGSECGGGGRETVREAVGGAVGGTPTCISAMQMRLNCPLEGLSAVIHWQVLPTLLSSAHVWVSCKNSVLPDVEMGNLRNLISNRTVYTISEDHLKRHGPHQEGCMC